MPEQPEVATIVDYLGFQLENQTLINLEIIGGKYLNKHPQGYKYFLSSLPFVNRFFWRNSIRRTFYFSFVFSYRSFWFI